MKFFGVQSYRRAVQVATVTLGFCKALGYVRQLLVAHFFGLARSMDIYLMGFGIATIVVLPFNTWYDQVVVPRLIQTHEADGIEGFKRLAGSVMVYSLFLTVALSVLFIFFFPLLSK